MEGEAVARDIALADPGQADRKASPARRPSPAQLGGRRRVDLPARLAGAVGLGERRGIAFDGLERDVLELGAIMIAAEIPPFLPPEAGANR